jgi:Zn-finger nucleic acid-binding protein
MVYIEVILAKMPPRASEAHDVDCPVCREPLVVVERDGIEVDWCLSCRGLWFDEGELALLAERTGRRLEPSDVGRPYADVTGDPPRRCPRCRRRMERVGAGHSDLVPVDRCLAHGVWLDRGELGRILARLPPRSDHDDALIFRFLSETFGGEKESRT